MRELKNEELHQVAGGSSGSGSGSGSAQSNGGGSVSAGGGGGGGGGTSGSFSFSFASATGDNTFTSRTENGVTKTGGNRPASFFRRFRRFHRKG